MKCFLQSECTFKNVIFFTVIFQECLKILRKLCRVSLPHRKPNRDLFCGSVRLEIWPNLFFESAEFAAFSKTMQESELTAIFVVFFAAVIRVVTRRPSPLTAVSGEGRCVTTLITAVKETTSDEGLTLETSASRSLFGGQFTLSTPLINQIFVYHICRSNGLVKAGLRSCQLTFKLHC